MRPTLAKHGVFLHPELTSRLSRRQASRSVYKGSRVQSAATVDHDEAQKARCHQVGKKPSNSQGSLGSLQTS